MKSSKTTAKYYDNFFLNLHEGPLEKKRSAHYLLLSKFLYPSKGQTHFVTLCLQRIFIDITLQINIFLMTPNTGRENKDQLFLFFINEKQQLWEFPHQNINLLKSSEYISINYFLL